VADRDEGAMILVTGAAGKTGLAVVAALADRGVAVRALVHHAGRSDACIMQGADEIVVGAFDDAAALAAATSGASAIYHICPNVSPYEVSYARAIIAAAKAAGAPRVVYHSVLHPQVEAMPHHWAKLRVEEMLLASGLAVTVLQPTAYMQNLLVGWRSIVEDGVYRVPYPVATRISLVDLSDVAEAAALVLTEDGHVGATYALVGTPALTQTEVAETLSLAIGRPVRAVAETVEVWEARVGAEMGDYQRQTLAAMFRSYAAHGLVGNANVLSWLLGVSPITLAEFAADALRDQL
jgi:NAD(P)H dehydrogenase (quinone)